MTAAAGLGPWPGTDPLTAHLAVFDVVADAPAGVGGMPNLVQLPARGPAAGAVGRSLALLEDLPAGLEPHGWRLRANPGADLRRARATLRADLEALAIAARGYAGPLVLPVLGPWSLASRVWLPRGERVLADPVAVRDLVDSLAVGLREHVADVRRRVPGAEPVVLLAEPALADVLIGAVPTFSGRARLAAIEGAVVREALRRFVAGLGSLRTGNSSGGSDDLRIHDAVGARSADLPVRGAHHDLEIAFQVPADPASVRLGASVGPGGLGLDVTAAGAALWEPLAEAAEAGVRPWLGVIRPVRDTAAGAGSEAVAAARALERAWTSIGLDRAQLTDVVVTPASGLAGVTPERAAAVLRAAVDAARDLAEGAGA